MLDYTASMPIRYQISDKYYSQIRRGMNNLLQRGCEAEWALLHSEELDEDPVELRRNYEQAVADVNAYVSEHTLVT